MKTEIIQLEQQVREAQLSHNFEFFEKVLADDFKFVTPQGKVVTKREDIDQYKSGHLKMAKVEISDQTIDLFGATAVVRFRVVFEGTAGTYSFAMKMFFTRVYSKDSGSWKMIAGHSCELK